MLHFLPPKMMSSDILITGYQTAKDDICKLSWEDFETEKKSTLTMHE